MKFLSEHSECTVNVEPQYEVVTPSRSDSRQVIGHIQVGGLVRIRAERSLVRYKNTRWCDGLLAAQPGRSNVH